MACLFKPYTLSSIKAKDLKPSESNPTMTLGLMTRLLMHTALKISKSKKASCAIELQKIRSKVDSFCKKTPVISY